MIDRKRAFGIVDFCVCPGHDCAFVRTSVSTSSATDYQEAADGLAGFISRAKPIDIVPAGETNTVDLVTGEVLRTNATLRMELPQRHPLAAEKPRRCDVFDIRNRRN